MDSNPAKDFLDRGSEYLEKRNFIAGLREFEKARDLNRRDPEILFKLGLAYDYLKMFQQALGCYRKALKIAPDMAGA